MENSSWNLMTQIQLQLNLREIKKNILEEKIFWNEFIQLDEKKDETKEIANTIKNLAERIMVS